VFPDAPVKFFITADVKVRAERRYGELAAKGVATTLERELAELIERDRRDSGPGGGLKQPPDAVVIDTTHLTPDEVLDRLEGEIRKWLPART
jgi:cytidylate kinase